MKTGRDSFHVYKLLISLAAYLFSIFPSWFQESLYRLSSACSGNFGAGVRYALLARKCGLVGSAYFAGYTVIKQKDRISIGENFSLHEFCYLDGTGGIAIGNNVSVAHGTSILSTEHSWSDSSIPIKYNDSKFAPVVIGNDVWVGCGVRILAGSHIADRVVVGSGAVVKGRLESGFVYAGVPAKKVKSLDV